VPSTNAPIPPAVTVDDAIERIGLGRFQWRLLGINGLVWAADAMEVLIIGFAIPSLQRGLDLGRAEAGLVGSIFFAGMLVGAWGFGALADHIGRRRVFLATVLLDGVFGLLSAVSPNYAFLLLWRFLTGAAVGGTLPVDYAVMAEYLPKHVRGRFLVFLESFWALGTIVLALVAWALVPSLPESGWRWLFAFAALPGLLGFVLRLWVPESPRYLLLTGRAAEAAEVLRRVARINRRTDVAIGRLERIERSGTWPTAALFREPLARTTLLLSSTWFFLSFGYYGVFVWLPGIFVAEGFGFVRGYGYLVLLALAQVPGYLLAAYWLERLGRRITLAIFLFASAVGCMIFALATTAGLIIAGSMLLSFSLLGAWGALYAYTPEVYPTEARATGMGWMGSMARAAGIFAPLLGGYLLGLSLPLALGLYAASLLIAGIASLLMRQDPTGQALSDSLSASATG
jgi:MFS transporter, putative metabolite:H+ symporter